MKKEKNKPTRIKKAELTGTATVEILILLVSLVIILGFIYFFYSKPSIDRDACHESVVLRDSVNVGILEASKKVVPLKCQTEKICLGDVCDINFGKETKENPITNVKLSSDEKKAKEQSLDAISEAMYNCHWMLGEGKLNFMPRGKLTENYCLICARFALDKNIEKIPEISYPELYEYMEFKKDSDGVNYLEYIYGVKNVDEMNPNLEVARQELNKGGKVSISSIDDMKVNLGNENGIIVEITPKGTLDAWISAFIAGGAVAAAVVASPFTGGASLLLVGAAAASGGAVGTIFYVKNFPKNTEYVYIAPAISVYNKEELQKLKCSSFETAP